MSFIPIEQFYKPTIVKRHFFFHCFFDNGEVKVVLLDGNHEKVDFLHPERESAGLKLYQIQLQQ